MGSPCRKETPQEASIGHDPQRAKTHEKTPQAGDTTGWPCALPWSPQIYTDHAFPVCQGARLLFEQPTAVVHPQGPNARSVSETHVVKTLHAKDGYVVIIFGQVGAGAFIDKLAPI
jgi:hypothetical protein